MTRGKSMTTVTCVSQGDTTTVCAPVHPQLSRSRTACLVTLLTPLYSNNDSDHYGKEYSLPWVRAGTFSRVRETDTFSRLFHSLSFKGGLWTRLGIGYVSRPLMLLKECMPQVSSTCLTNFVHYMIVDIGCNRHQV